nr:hypothetical protein [Tanacetum cinerariifolium]
MRHKTRDTLVVRILWSYTEVSSPFEDLSDIGSPRVVVYEYDGLSMYLPSLNYVPEPKHPPSPDYVSSPEHPPSPIYVPYVLEPVYPEFMPHEDDVLPAEEQPQPAAVLPTIDSPIYITESDPEEDPKEDDEDPEEDPTDFPINRDDDEEEEKSFKDDADYEEDDEAEEEHLAPANSVARLLSIPTPSPSPLTSYSSPLQQIPSPPLPVSPTYPLGYRAAMIWLRSESPSTSHPLPLSPPIVLSHTRASMAMMRATTPSTYILAPRSETPPSGTPSLLPIPLPTSSPPLLLPSTDCRADVLEVTLPPRKRLYISIDREICYEIIDVWEDPYEIAEQIPTTDDDRLLMSNQLNSLRRDRYSYARTARLMKSEARASREAWATYHRQQTQLAEALTLLKTLRTQMAALQCQLRPARDPAHPDVPEEAARDADRSRNGEDNHDSGTGLKRQAPFTRECTYPDFMKCKPLYFKGTEGVVELTQWFERMETAFCITNCTTVGHDVAYAMTWTNLKKKMTDKYCPRGEIKKLNVEMWKLKVKRTDVVSYNQRFQELALMCARIFPEESDKIERLRIKGSLRTLQGTIRTNNNKTGGRTLVGLRLLGLARRNLTEDLNLCALNATITMMVYVLPNATSVTKLAIWPREFPELKNNNRGNQGGNGNAPAKVYVVGNAGTNPDSNVITCTNSTNFSGTKFDARKDVKKDVSSLRYIVLPNWVHEEHLESISSQPQEPCNTDAPESSGNSNPTATSTNPPESNRVEADVSNMEASITASPTPTLRIHKDHPKSQIIGPVDTPIQTRNKSKEKILILVFNNNNNNNQKVNGCYEYGAQGHFKRNCPKLENNNRGNQGENNNAQARVYVVGNAGANIDNIVAAFDFSELRHASRFCPVLSVFAPICPVLIGNETLIIRGDRSGWGNETHLNIISCTKMHKYMLKGCHVFLAHVTTKKAEDKSEEKRLAEVPIVGDFPKVFSEDILGPIRQRFYKTQFLTLGSSSLVCQEEEWIVLNVHRLPRIEQAGVQTSSAGATQILSSGNTSSLAVGKYSSSGIFIIGSRNGLSILFLTILP